MYCTIYVLYAQEPCGLLEELKQWHFVCLTFTSGKGSLCSSYTLTVRLTPSIWCAHSFPCTLIPPLFVHLYRQHSSLCFIAKSSMNVCFAFSLPDDFVSPLISNNSDSLSLLILYAPYSQQEPLLMAQTATLMASSESITASRSIC